MNDDYRIIPYAGTTPGADANTYTLFNSVPYRAADRSPVRFADYARYLVALKNSNIGTLKASASADGGVTWFEYYEVAVPVSTAQRMNQASISLEGHIDVKVEWVNGGVAQTTWYVAQALDDGVAPLRAVFFDAAGDADPGDSTTINSPQLPSSLGQKTKAGSLPVVQASDWVDPQLPATIGVKATSALSLSVAQALDSALQKSSSLRAPMRSEVYPIAVTTASKRFAVPAAWLGRLVRFQADGADVGLQVSTGLDATASLTTRAAESAPDGNSVITLTVAADGCSRIYLGDWLDLPIPLTAQTFALIGAAACAVRTHLAET